MATMSNVCPIFPNLSLLLAHPFFLPVILSFFFSLPLLNFSVSSSLVHSFCSLSYDRSVASSKASSPQGAI
jgi:hypothetical protein